MTGRLRVDVAWLWLGYLGRSLAYLGLTAVLARSLGPNKFGDLALFLALTLGVAQIAATWVFMAVPVLAARYGSIGAAFRPAFQVASVSTIFALLVVVPIQLGSQSPSAVSVAALIVYAAALAAMQGAYGVFQAAGRMSGIAVAQTAERLTGLIAIGAVAFAASLTVEVAQSVLAAAAALTCAGAYWYLHRHYRIWAPDERLGIGRRGYLTPRQVVGSVGGMAIVGLCAYGVAWLGVYVVAFFESSREVGLYALAYQITNFIIQVGSLWAVATLPRHAKASAEGQPLIDQLPIRQLYMVASLWAFLVGLVAAGSVVAVPLAFGDSFHHSLPSLITLCVGIVFLAPYFVVVPALVSVQRSGLIAIVSVISLVINLVLAIAMVPLLGIVGAAIATSAQFVISSAALVTAGLGWKTCARLFAFGLPSAITLLILATDPGGIVPRAILLVGIVISLIMAIYCGRGMALLSRPGSSQR